MLGNENLRNYYIQEVSKKIIFFPTSDLFGVIEYIILYQIRFERNYFIFNLYHLNI